MHIRRLFALIARTPPWGWLLLPLAGLVVLGAALLYQGTFWSSDGVAGAGTGPAAVPMQFGEAEAVRGAEVLMLRLASRTVSGKFASGYGGSDVRNVLLVVGRDAAAHWLFKGHQNLVRKLEQLSGDPNDPQDGDTAALYVEYVSADTDGDQRLTFSDRFNVALAAPDGTRLQVLLTDVQQVFSRTVLDDDELAVVYQKAGSVRHTRFAFPSGKLLADKVVAPVPQAL